MYDRKPTRRIHEDVPSALRPTYCAVESCRSRWNTKTRQYERGFADIVFTLDNGVQVARCGDCYDKQIYAAGKGRYCWLTGRDYRYSLEDLREYWETLE